MSRLPAFCKIILDTDSSITRWVCAGLNFNAECLGEYYTLGFFVGDKLIGGLVYHNIRPGRDLWWTIFTTDKRWCNRRVLKIIFALAFNYWQVKRISLLINTDNHDCIKLVEKLGFKREGLMRQYRDDGSDCYFYGILKSENIWKGKNNE